MLTEDQRHMCDLLGLTYEEFEAAKKQREQESVAIATLNAMDSESDKQRRSISNMLGHTAAESLAFWRDVDEKNAALAKLSAADQEHCRRTGEDPRTVLKLTGV